MTAKSTILIVSIAFSLAAENSPVAAQDPSADEVVAKCAAALGGEENWRAITALEISGSQMSFSKERPFVLRRMRPNLYRLDLSEGIRPMIIAFDGERGWWKREILVASRGDWELPAPEVYTRTFRADAEFEMPCLNHREEGYRIEFLGRRELDAEPYFQLRVTLADESVENWYLDTESFLPAARVSAGAYWRLPQEQRTFFDDYREVAGAQIPFYVEIECGNLNRAMNVEQVEVNKEIDPEIFSMPPPDGMAELAELAGRWNVEIKSRENAESPWEESTAISTISRHSGGGLLEEDVSYVAATAFPLTLQRFFSYDRFRQVFRIVAFDNFTSRLNVLEGTLEDGRLTVSNLSTGTPWSVYGNTFHSREQIYDLSESSFKFTRETSTDAGVTWFVEEELSYSRVEAD